MKSIPPGMKPYERTPGFTRSSTPAGLLRGHHTKEGQGYHIQEPEVVMLT